MRMTCPTLREGGATRERISSGAKQTRRGWGVAIPSKGSKQRMESPENSEEGPPVRKFGKAFSSDTEGDGPGVDSRTRRPPWVTACVQCSAALPPWHQWHFCPKCEAEYEADMQEAAAATKLSTRAELKAKPQSAELKARPQGRLCRAAGTVLLKEKAKQQQQDDDDQTVSVSTSPAAERPSPSRVHKTTQPSSEEEWTPSRRSTNKKATTPVKATTSKKATTPVKATWKWRRVKKA